MATVIIDSERGANVSEPDQDYDRPAGFHDVLAKIADLAELLEAEEPILRARLRSDMGDGFPPRSLGGGGSPTSIIDDDGVPIPQHSDPVGELVVRDPEITPIGVALSRGFDAVCRASRALEEARSHFARTRRPDTIDEIEDRSTCASCWRVHQLSPTYRDSNVGGRLGKPTPLCRNCYDDVIESPYVERGRLPLLGVVRARAEGRRITTKVLEASVREEREERQRRRKGKKGRR